MSFQGDISKFAQKTGIAMDKIVRKVNIDMTRDLVKLTPVDTGLARSNWFFGFERDKSVDSSRVKSGSPSFARSAAFASTLKAGDVWYITNNVSYIMPLEYGHSKKAPGGMARVTVARWQEIVGKAARS